VHIVFGQDDPYLNAGVAADFQRVTPGATLLMVPQAGHYVQLDQAALVAREVLLRLGVGGVR
jgi:haloalkane dehalogenase